MTVGVVLLAAGGSSRLGHPKQLVHYQGTTLVRRAAEAAACLRCGPVVASAYEDTQGVPALFARDVFPELDALSPGQGARGVIARVASRVVDVPLPGGGDDVDTPEDVSRLT